MNCPIQDFKSWIEARNMTFPVEQSKFGYLFTMWATTSAQGLSHVRNSRVFISNGFVKSVWVTVVSKGSTSSTPSEKEKIY